MKFKKNFGNNLTKNSLAKNINKDKKPPRNREFGRALVGSLVVQENLTYFASNLKKILETNDKK